MKRKRKCKPTEINTKPRSTNLDKKVERKLILTKSTESGMLQIERKADENHPGAIIEFPQDVAERYNLPPEEFAEVQDALEAYRRQQTETDIFINSLESRVGYDSLIRVMGNFYVSRVAYYRSENGGSLSIEEAREAVYRKTLDDDEAVKMVNNLMRYPTDIISFSDLLSLNDVSPTTAQNFWEGIKQEAKNEFESGHRAAAAFEPADYMKDAWNRASYLGLRDSLIEEWQPKGGIELTMIDAITQAWLMLQHWTEESVRRAKTRPREEDHQYREWKKWKQATKSKQWDDGFWDIQYVEEQKTIEHAAQMADRWQRMYFRAIRSLRDWRRYSPNLTINNANQVNIANDGGQQVNLNKS